MRFTNRPTGEPRERWGKWPWAVMMWRDGKHVMKELAGQVRDGLGVKWEVAEHWARDADTVGLKVILASPNPVVAFHAANMLHQLVALPSTIPESPNIPSSKTTNSTPTSYSHLATLPSMNGPAAAYATAHDNLLFNIVQVAQWYTGQVVTTDGVVRLVIPPVSLDKVDQAQKRRLDSEIPAFSVAGKKGLAIIRHIRSTIKHDETRRVIVKQNQLFNRLLGFIIIFVGIQPQRRQKGGHIEYEIEWLRSFIVLGDLSGPCRDMGDIFFVASTRCSATEHVPG
ncbi:hypothetical protein L198_06460 [Cryptococcus wingfieldii CBS 7118]|uniref:Uncharacterized protein n=1 Tax=Cryptococcus wingfieldii CBS 7118 TaxID=1295528 RepID=A0A1E3IN63_9TREE|nr:hypothetical protein L198_06460 [Cryptococcus wingfieldii CBS 7118]ODN89141.1 hypothetical protein L198_06460 [Cryptococcus wingfieldii CBS 7118]